jgi:hypothetical protein
VNADDPLTRAIGEWQCKHHIADGDPMIAALELVRIYLKHSRETDNDPTASPPSFEDFRGTIELLDRRSKAFVHKPPTLSLSCDDSGKTSLASIEHTLATHAVFIALGAVAGVLIDRLL